MTDLAVLGIGRCGPEGFDVATALPGRGYRRLPPAAQYLLAAANEAVAPLGGLPESGVGAAIGTNNGCVQMLHEMNETIITKDAAAISPVAAPFFVVSLPAGRLAIELGIRGFCVTLTSPRTAGLDALQLGTRALAAGRAGFLLAGATETALPDAEPGHQGSDAGAVVLACAPADRVAADGASPLGVLQVRTAFVADPAAVADALDEPLNALTEPAPQLAVTAVLDDSAIGRAIGGWLTARGADVSRAHAPAGCLTPLGLVADALAASPAGAGPGAIVITAAAEGNVALARVLPWPERNGSRC
jgi:3-oxoacyl-[acyl-carrier-protein] synthase II